MHIDIGIGSHHLDKSLHHWINDGLMAVFFFVVGLEIKREILVGELSTLRKALLPIVAALGGMLVPAGLYVWVNAGQEGVHGWGIPMATDIAFALGILALLGSRVPTGLKVFLTAVAIVDDLGAIVVIAVGYTEHLVVPGLTAAAFFLLALITLDRLLHIRSPLPYALLGFGLWVALLHSGVHATLAGVLTAMTIPARTLLEGQEFLKNGRRLLDEFERHDTEETTVLEDERRLSVIHALEVACEQAETPLQRLEHAMQPWVTFFVMPLFALANAGVTLHGDLFAGGLNPVATGVLLGLVIGKQIGVTLFAWAAVRLGIADLPESVSWRQIYAVGWLAGIGFTMSIFISNLAFGSGDLLEDAKLAILGASVLASLGGLTLLARATRR
jgi:NhaA family Na+:H+ antiporter